MGQLCTRGPTSTREPPRENARVRQTDFWQRMAASFGPAYADSLARDQVLAALGGRTIVEALAAGDDVKDVWRAVVATFEVPVRLR